MSSDPKQDREDPDFDVLSLWHNTFEDILGDAAGDLFHTAIWFILGACFLISSMVDWRGSADMTVPLDENSILLRILSHSVLPPP